MRRIFLVALFGALLWTNSLPCRADASDGTYALTMRCLTSGSGHDYYDSKCVGKLRKKLERYVLKGDNPEENRWIANALVTYYNEEHIAEDATTAEVRGKQQVYLVAVGRGEAAADQVAAKSDARNDDTLRWMRDKAQYQAEAEYFSGLDAGKYRHEIRACHDQIKSDDRLLNPKAPSAWGTVLLAAAGAASDSMAARQQQQAQQQAAQQQAQIAAQQQQAQIAAQQRAQAQAAQQAQLAAQQRQHELAALQASLQRQAAANQQAQVAKQQQAAQAPHASLTSQSNSGPSVANANRPAPKPSDISIPENWTNPCLTGGNTTTATYRVSNASDYVASVRIQLLYHLGTADSSYYRDVVLPPRQNFEGTIQDVPCSESTLKDNGTSNIVSWQFQ